MSVIRRDRDTHPVPYDDGTGVDELAHEASATDEGCVVKRVYYYTFFTRPDEDAHGPASKQPGERCRYGRLRLRRPVVRDAAGHLPSVRYGIYESRRSRSARRAQRCSATVSGPAGAQLDHLYSLARTALDLHDVDRVDGQLLPLLAQWLGWRTDRRMPVLAQRREIRSRSRNLLLGRNFRGDKRDCAANCGVFDFQAKEFVHNIAAPMSRNGSTCGPITRDDSAAAWGTPNSCPVNYVFEGRPARVLPDPRSDLFLYHTRRQRNVAEPARCRISPTESSA